MIRTLLFFLPFMLCVLSRLASIPRQVPMGTPRIARVAPVLSFGLAGEPIYAATPHRRHHRGR
jgi:hypothetical protein